jgi:hypothetical protein
MYPCFDLVVGLVWSNDPKSCAGGSEAAGSVSNARQVKRDDPDKKGYPGSPKFGSWAWGSQPYPIKMYLLETWRQASDKGKECSNDGCGKNICTWNVKVIM